MDFLVYGNHVGTISLRNLIAVVIEDPAISKAQRKILETWYDSIQSS